MEGCGAKVQKLFPLVGIMGVSMFVACAFPFSLQTEEANVRISDFPVGQVQTGVLSAGQRGLTVGQEGAVVAVWSDTREGQSNIYLTRSLDGARTFATNVRVNDAPGAAGLFGATVAVDQKNRASVVWFDDRDGDYDIFFARELNGGQGFTKNVRVNDDKSARARESEFMPDDFFDTPEVVNDDAFQTLPCIAIGPDGTIFIAWQDYRRNQADIYFSTSTDGGKTFSSNVRVNDDFGRAGQLYPSLAVDQSGNLYLAWHDFRKGDQDIYFSKSVDGGKTFSRNVRINDDFDTAGQFNPSLAVDEENAVHIAWHDLRNNDEADIYYATSRDGGLTFSRNIRVNDDKGEAFQFHPSLGINGQGDIGIAWEDYRNGHADVYFAKKPKASRSFGSNIRMNNDHGKADHLHASVAGTSETPFVVMWEDQRNAARGFEGPCQPVYCSDIYVVLEGH